MNKKFKVSSSNLGRYVTSSVFYTNSQHCFVQFFRKNRDDICDQFINFHVLLVEIRFVFMERRAAFSKNCLELRNEMLTYPCYVEISNSFDFWTFGFVFTPLPRSPARAC